ncbi:FAS1 domain-containing protein [Aspergillus eucalypticola CBS 122712]|uniref:FAS1 domain-containing protein n=1 Tax=Aspergillus eucalypticola (strain CBS 122712 / IBT 29274) TaxID=1448314 RepID=A0A317WGE3_ASPEC|nr:FAS1 domain-containing protein [Aspergillus eucalypticola CBS 122712]PWY85534.1 FAS1 domain-containing protein [Aspergillus eucalypticola CBS 122712]
MIYPGLLSLIGLAIATTDSLNYRNIPGYVAPSSSNTTTALDFIKSRSDLSILSEKIDELGGFAQALDTDPDWKFTFFAPNNDAFEKYTGAYFDSFEPTPKGKWWLGNTIIHHYVPNSEFTSAIFNETLQRFQTATYLFVSSQVQDETVILNQVARVVESDIPVTSGVMHIIDRILDPSAQIFEPDLPRMSQTFIAGSCSNPQFSYC